MFGKYSNQRVSETESKLLCKEPDDFNWYAVYLTAIFKDSRNFEVREDIRLPQSDDDDNGVVLIFEDREVVYFKTLDRDVTEEEVISILEVCNYLEGLFNSPIKAYVVCRPDVKRDVGDVEGEGDVTIIFSFLMEDDGEKIIEKLEAKLKSKEEFTISDSIDHMLLPYTGFKDKKIFQEKFKRYMQIVNEYGGH